MLLIKNMLNKANSKTVSASATPALTEDLITRVESKIREGINPKFELDNWVVDPQGVHYYPHFMEAQLCKELSVCIQGQPSDKWVNLTHAKRRLQKWGGDVTESGLQNISEIPPFLVALIDKLEQEGVTQKRCNHFLINEYKGQAGILPHTDGPLYHPWVSVLSLGSPILFKFYASHFEAGEDDPTSVILIEEGSLLVFHGKYYHELLHGINEVGVESLAIKLDIKRNDGVSAADQQQMMSKSASSNDQEKYWSCTISSKQAVDNFTNTRLYLNFLKPEIEQGSFNKLESVEAVVEKLKASFDGRKVHGRYTLDVLEKYDQAEEGSEKRLIGCSIAASWVRDSRVSLTIRYVPPAPNDSAPTHPPATDSNSDSIIPGIDV